MLLTNMYIVLMLTVLFQPLRGDLTGCSVPAICHGTQSWLQWVEQGTEGTASHELHARLDKLKEPDWILAPNGRQYLFHSEVINGGWQGARQFCLDIGADIAIVGMRDPRIAKYLVNNFVRGQEGQISMWIGLTDLAQEGLWLWADEVPASDGYTDWNPSQPDDYRGGQDCGYLWSRHDFRWDDGHCTGDLGVVCEREI